jgi:AraC-like DNA-binding protein
MAEFSIILPDGGDIHFLPEIPDSLKQIRMPFAEIATAISHTSKMVFQHVQGDGFDLWWSKYSASENVKVIGTSDMAIIELHIALRNHFKSNWDGIGEPSMKALQFNFSYAPFINNTSWFVAGQEYETFDFHFTRTMLEPYAAVYPDLEAFLGKVDKSEMAHLSVECVLTRKMQSLLGEIRSFRCRPGIYLKTLKAMVETLLTLALEELSYTKPLKKLAITPGLIEKARQAKAILDSRLSDPPSIEELARLCISNVYSIQVAFKHCFGTTIHEYSLDARLEYAKGLLLDTKLNLNTIADEAGFYDGPAFAKFFKNRTGCTPGEFRKYGKVKSDKR